MSLPQNKETGANTMARYCSESLVQIPMKKRRFLFELFSSQAESPQSVENSSSKEPSNLSQGSSFTNVNAATSSLLPTIKDTPHVEEKKESSKCSRLKVKIDEPRCSVSSNSIVESERKSKNIGEIHASQIDLGLKEGSSRKGLCIRVENTELSLGPNKIGHGLIAGDAQNVHEKQEKEDPVSLNLSLSKGNCSQRQSDNVELNIKYDYLLSNRLLWDLNKTMDKWEIPSNDAATCEVATQTLSLVEKVSDGVAFETQKIEDKKHRAKILRSSNDSHSESWSSEGQSSSSARVSGGSFFRNLQMQELMVPPCKPNVVGGHSNVKLETFDVSINQNLKGTKENSEGILDCKTLISGLGDKRISLKPTNSSISTIEGFRSIKSQQLSSTMQKTYVSESGNISNVLSHEFPQQACLMGKKNASKAVSTSLIDQEVNKSNEIERTVDDHNELCRLNLNDKNSVHKSLNWDEEKINISDGTLEKDSFSSDYVSDGYHINANGLDTDDDDYEDGEFREPSMILHAAATKCLMSQKIREKYICSDDKKTNSSGLTVDEATSYADEKNYHCKSINESSEEPEVVDQNLEQGTNKATSLRNTVGKNKRKPISAYQIKVLDRSYDRTVDKKQMGPNQGGGTEEKDGSAFSKDGGRSLHDDDGLAKEKSKRSRIINLKLSKVSSSSYKPRTGRERFADSVFEDDKLCHSQGREEFYNEGHHRRFTTERNRDKQAFRSSRGNYSRGRGRGRGFNRQNTNWDSDCDFSPEFLNDDSIDLRFNRRRHGGFNVNDEEFEGDDYRVIGASRGRGQFRHFSSRRRSPDGRERPVSRGDQMIRRTPRNFSGEEGLLEDIVDDDSNMFTHNQDSFEGQDGNYHRGRRNFTSFQSKGGRPNQQYRTDRIRSPEYLESPMRPPRPFHEMIGGDDRRRSRGRDRNFRSHRINFEEDLCFNREESSRRSNRFCREPETKLKGRGNRADGNVHSRRAREIEEGEDGNFRSGEGRQQGWHNDDDDRDDDECERRNQS